MRKIFLLSLIYFGAVVADVHALTSLQIEQASPRPSAADAQPQSSPQGIHREYFDNGTLKSEVGYKNGKFNGRCRFYYANGILRKQVHYDRGVLDGKAFEFYENGQYKVEGNFKNGVIDDVNRFYYENGNLYSFMVYQDGDLIKSYTLDPSGRAVK